MKQYWRVGAIRALTSLGLGMLVIGRMYVAYVPILQDMGFFGAILFGTVLFFIFLGIGWLYDIKARMWTQKLQASRERNVYQYVPNFKDRAIDFPLIYALIHTIRNVFRKTNQSTENIDDLIIYMEGFFSGKPVKRDIDNAKMKAKEYWRAYQFQKLEEEDSKKSPWNSRIKLAFETQMLRLNWIQSLTGILQDVIIFGALYVLILYPGVPFEFELFFAIVGISLPLLFVLLVAGWYYDKKLQLWSPDMTVKVERNPYSYVAEPYLFSMVLPFFYTYLLTLRSVLAKKGSNTTDIDEFLKYLSEYCNLRVSKDEDFKGAYEIRKSLGTLFKASDSGS